MASSKQLADHLKTHPEVIGPVVDFDPVNERLFHFDLTIANKDLDAATIADTEKFNRWVNTQLTNNGCKYGVGGYMENRTIYAHSPLFNSEEGQRRHHLGVDIWGSAGTAVYAPLSGKIHSFKNNNNFGDYGPTIILEHNLNGLPLYTLYGHLSAGSLTGLSAGMTVKKGQQIGSLGHIGENGNWPPHLHFQLMLNLEGRQGDYPGVCSLAEKDKYRSNMPDPQLILRFPKAVNE